LFPFFLQQFIVRPVNHKHFNNNYVSVYILEKESQKTEIVIEKTEIGIENTENIDIARSRGEEDIVSKYCVFVTHKDVLYIIMCTYTLTT